MTSIPSPRDSRPHPKTLPYPSRALYWAPRLLGIAFAAFLGVFALDVFAMPLGIGDKTVALMMHLIPSLVVLAALAVVWRWEWVGALLFPALALFHLTSKWGQLDVSGYVVIELPLLLLGALFYVSWRAHGMAVERTT